jgi:anti-sigma factor RsiW
MDCPQARTVIECYADGELDALMSARLEEHLRRCAGCSAALERLRSLSALIKEASPLRTAPDRLSRDIIARTRRAAAAPTRTEHGWRHWWRPAMLVAGTAAVTWLVAGQLMHSPSGDPLAEELVSTRARATLTGHVTDVASSERHTVKPWLTSKLDFSPPVTDLSAEGFPLIGSRLDYVDRRPVAVLVYGRRRHVIDLFVWPHDGEKSVPVSLVPSKRGYQMAHWTDGGMTFWAVSDLNAAELKAFGEKFSAK